MLTYSSLLSSLSAAPSSPLSCPLLSPLLPRRRAHLGAETHTPLVGMTVELTANRFNALGEPIAPQRAEVAGYVEDEIPYGVYDFFRVDNLADMSSISPYTCSREHVHLACKITRCH